MAHQYRPNTISAKPVVFTPIINEGQTLPSMGVNIGCIDGIEPFSFANIPVTHGASESHFDP